MCFLAGIKEAGHTLHSDCYFDTITVEPKSGDVETIKQRAVEKEINLRYHSNGMVSERLCK